MASGQTPTYLLPYPLSTDPVDVHGDIFELADRLEDVIFGMSLPSQSGNNGKFLTTNGSVASWATVDSLPSQSGNNGKFLTTDGTSASWATISVSDATASASGKVFGETNSITNTVALGYNVSPTSNEVTLGNSSIDKFRVPGIGLVASTTSTLFGAPIKEKINSLGTVSSSPIAFNILTASVINMVVGTGANFTINFRGSSTVTLNSMLAVDESITVVFIANSPGTYYPNTLQIDGGAGTIVNNRWQGGTAPTAGTGGSADLYTFNIQKVANNLYQMFSSQTKFG